MVAQQNPLSFPAAAVGRAHTILAAAAFTSALCIGSLLHYKKIVKNGVAGYPHEWFPSVSATIGDWYPERNIFQILIAVTSVPRFILVALQYYLHRSRTSSLPALVFIFGLIRTISCGGWVYITSSDDHDIHDIMMITYMVCNIPWMIGGIRATPLKSSVVRRKRTYIATVFFVTIIPLIYYFIQHKIYRIPGAYTRYAFFEWGLIFSDILYDSVIEQEFREANLQITIGSLATRPLTASDHSSEIAIPTVTSEKPKSDGSAIVKTADKALEDAAKLALASPTLHEKNLFASIRQIANFTSDVYLSYIFWSILTSLIPTLFYFSIWELGISGQELALLSVLSPIFLSVTPFLNWARSRGGQTILHILSFSGLAAYLLDKPLDRLFAVAFANVVLIIRQSSEWAGQGKGDNVGYQAIVTGLGLMVSALAKHANHSNNPVWPFIDPKNGGYNKTGLTLALISVFVIYTRQHRRISPFTPPGRSRASDITPPWFTSGISLGSLLFTAHNLLADPSTLVAWSWTGFTNGHPRGPVPHVHGFLTLIAQSIGILAPLILPSLDANPLASPVWFLYGAGSAYVMYMYRNWLGYVGSLNHALFLMSIFPLVLQKAADTEKVARTYTTAMLVYCLLNLASIFTAAYAFVPGGQIFREHTDLVTIGQMVGISFAFRSPYSKSGQTYYTIPQHIKSYAKILLACISVLSVLVSVYRLPSTAPKPYKPGPRVINAGIWTIHFGFDNIGHDSQRGVRNLVKDMQLDIVGLLETDLHRTAFGHRDLTRVIVEEGYNVDIGPGPNSHTWGCVLLTKFPIINTTHHLLPSPHGELAPAIEAVLDVYGTPITVVVSHNGQEEDALDRELQSRKLAEIMSASHHPVIFLGYVVTKPHAQRPNPYEIMVKDGNVHDIDHEDLDRWCEYIFYRGLYRTAYARISRGIITDTEMQVGQFVLPKYGYGVAGQSVEARYLRARKEDLPVAHWFPMEYYGSPIRGGVDGHFYHVFGTPLYYKLPETAIV